MCHTRATKVWPRWKRAGRVQLKWQTSDTSATWVRQKQHNFNTSVIRTTRLRHEWNIFILITTRVKTYFHTPILDMWWMKYFKERNNFILGTPLLEISPSHPKMRLKSAPQKLKFVMAESILKSYKLDYSYKFSDTFRNSYT